MSKGPPTLIAIDPDDRHATHIGRLSDGRQFFVTTPFIPERQNDPRREFVAVYIFDQHGTLLEARIDELGSRAKLDWTLTKQLFDRRFAELGPVDLCRIEVRPFEIERLGAKFGLVPRRPETDEDDGDGWWVVVQPGNYMAFHAPWDSGEYDT